MSKCLLKVREAAEFLGVSEGLLNKWRMAPRQHEGPRFIRLGKRRIAYDIDDLRTWVDSGRVGPRGE